MNEDIKLSEKSNPKDPETSVKRTVYKTTATKFRDLLRQSQQIQTEFKNGMKNKIKKQLKVAKNNATEDEIEELSRDPEAAAQVLKEMVQGKKAHAKLQNTVADIQNKYKDILRLEQV